VITIRASHAGRRATSARIDARTVNGTAVRAAWLGNG
jgi:hypothetical protein